MSSWPVDIDTSPSRTLQLSEVDEVGRYCRLGAFHRSRTVAFARRFGLFVIGYCARLFAMLLIGGFLCATLVRLSPGYGVSEEELDSRLNAESRQALRDQASDQGLTAFYVGYWVRLLHGDLGTARSLRAPIEELIRERSRETLTSAGLGLLIGWALGLPLAIATVMTRSAAIKVSANVLASIMLCVPAGVLALLCIIWQAPGRLVLGLVVFHVLVLHFHVATAFT